MWESDEESEKKSPFPLFAFSGERGGRGWCVNECVRAIVSVQWTNFLSFLPFAFCVCLCVLTLLLSLLLIFSSAIKDQTIYQSELVSIHIPIHNLSLKDGKCNAFHHMILFNSCGSYTTLSVWIYMCVCVCYSGKHENIKAKFSVWLGWTLTENVPKKYGLHLFFVEKREKKHDEENIKYKCRYIYE